MNKRFLHYLLCILASYLLTLSSASAEKFLLISDTNHRYHQQLTHLLVQDLSSLNHQTSSIDQKEMSDIDVSNYSSLITIGYQAALNVMLENYNKPVLSLLIPKQVFNLLLTKHQVKENHYLFSSIYIDQPISRQIRLINYLSSDFKRVGILYGKHSYSRRNSIAHYLKSSGLEVNNITVLERTELISETRYLSENSDLLLAIPDKTIYNRRSIKGILLTTYRNKIPVIGYSQAYVKAGALAAVYSTAHHISLHAIEVIDKNLKHSYISATRIHPKYYEIALNKKVARSLNIQINDKELLLERLKQAESESQSRFKSQGISKRG